MDALEHPVITPEFHKHTLEHSKKFNINEEAASYSEAVSNPPKSKSTLYYYHVDLKQFQRWCDRYNAKMIETTPAMIANFLAEEASSGLKLSTIKRRATAIRYFFLEAGIDPLPTDSRRVRETINGIRKKLDQSHQSKAALSIEQIQSIVKIIDIHSLAGLRDRALILLGFFGGFKRSELADLKFEDLKFEKNNLLISLQSNSDFLNDEEFKEIDSKRPILRIKNSPFCPVQALEDWMNAANIKDSFVFRGFTKSGNLRALSDNPDTPALSGQTINLIVKAYIDRIGLDPSQYGAHSLRSGCVKHLLKKGKTLIEVQKFIGHKLVGSTSSYYD